MATINNTAAAVRNALDVLSADVTDKRDAISAALRGIAAALHPGDDSPYTEVEYAVFVYLQLEQHGQLFARVLPAADISEQGLAQLTNKLGLTVYKSDNGTHLEDFAVALMEEGKRLKTLDSALYGQLEALRNIETLEREPATGRVEMVF